MLHASSRLRAALTLLLTTATLPAAAAHLEVQGGRSYMDTHGANTAFVEATFASHPVGSSGLTWSPDVSLGWIDSRDDVWRYRGAEFEATHPVALLAAGARFHHDTDAWYRPLFFSFQLAAIDQTTQALSSHYQFVSTVGWQGEHLSFQFRHVSNGGINGPNRGETMALVGVGFDL